ncbi:hypothetical protein [Arenibacter sp. 6A1]|uniref:hypothetical protein n=1 Tax=Arenibacter sp. 6A1 TaxID=2720391 RepID=UPI00197B4BDE|nr:hypothetical protein [Arenibacter sp. 6A1]
MNYIKHLNAIFEVFASDERLNPTHISLYFALFQMWNENRFPNSFLVDRNSTMLLSKIGSRTTYHRCISNLHQWEYIVYEPSQNRFKGSRVRMPIFEISPGQVADMNDTTDELAVVSYININKHIKTNNKLSRESIPKNEQVVLNFFKNNHWEAVEATRFYNHYQGIGWKVGGKSSIEDWRAFAKKWMLKANELNADKEPARKPRKKGKVDYLQTTIKKNYGEPL